MKIWAGSHEGEGLPDFRTEKQPIENSPGCEVKKELKVTTEVLLMKGRLDESMMDHILAAVGPAEKRFYSSML